MIKSLKNGFTGVLLAVMLATMALPAPRTEAATLQELQAQIQALLAQIQALQNNGSGTTSACSPFTNDLTLGRSGSEVTALQRFLMSRGYSIPAGATGYFGGQTQAALAAFQGANAISPAVGYFGPFTRAKVNSLCSTVVTPPTDTPGDSTDTTTPPLKGEASLEDFDASSGDDTNLEEGQKNVSVMDVEFNVEDGDVRINRIDLGFTPDSMNNETDPWDTFSEVSIYTGNNRIARVDASKESNWTEDSPSNGDFRLRLSGVNWTIDESETAEFSVRISTENNIKGANDGEVWNIFVPTNGIRGTDGDRTNVYTGDSADTVTFDIDEAGSEDELIIKRSDQDIDSTTLQLKSNAQSGWVTVFAFDIDTDDSTNDIEIRKLPIQLTVSSSTVGTFVRDARIQVDGKTYTKKTIVDGATNTMTFDFNKGELVIDAGNRISVEIDVEFKQLASEFEGTTIVGSIDTSEIIAKGADSLTGSQLSGNATGESHTMRTSGVIIGTQNTSAVLQPNSNSTREDDQGVYTIRFDLTAFERDIFIAKSATRGTTLSTGGVNFTMIDTSAGSLETASGTVATSLSSNARTEGGYYKVAEGETKTFTLSVNYDPEYNAFYKVQLHSINWSSFASEPTAQQLALPEQKFETTVLFIGN